MSAYVNKIDHVKLKTQPLRLHCYQSFHFLYLASPIATHRNWTDTVALFVSVIPILYLFQCDSKKAV